MQTQESTCLVRVMATYINANLSGHMVELNYGLDASGVSRWGDLQVGKQALGYLSHLQGFTAAEQLRRADIDKVQCWECARITTPLPR